LVSIGKKQSKFSALP
jgi:hypothetical protein